MLESTCMFVYIKFYMHADIRQDMSRLLSARNVAS